MPVTLRLSPPEDIVVPVELSPSESFDVVLRPPSLRSELQAIFSNGDWAERVISSVVGWRGVNDEAGNPIPFTTENFASLVRQHPVIVPRIVNSIVPLYQTVSEAERKNSDPPCKTGSGQPSAAATMA